MELVLECIVKIALEKVLEAMAEGPHVVRAVIKIARRIALMVLFGMGL